MGIVVDHPGERRFEAGLMGAALGGVDVVGKREDVFVITVVILHGHFCHVVLPLGGQIDHFRMERGLIPVQMLHKLPDAALIAHLIDPDVFVIPLVGESDGDAGIEEGLLPQPVEQHIVIVFHRLKDGVIGFEAHKSAPLIGIAGDVQRAFGHAPVKADGMHMAVQIHIHRQPLGQGVDHAGAHAMEAAGDLVAAVAEFAAGMEDGIHHFHRGNTHFMVNPHRNATAVVPHGDHIVLFNGHFDMGTVTGQRLVDGVVHDFINQVMQAPLGCGADVHTRPFPHRFQAFQHLYLTFVISGFNFLDISHCFFLAFYGNCRRSSKVHGADRLFPV